MSQEAENISGPQNMKKRGMVVGKDNLLGGGAAPPVVGRPMKILKLS